MMPPSVASPAPASPPIPSKAQSPALTPSAATPGTAGATARPATPPPAAAPAPGTGRGAVQVLGFGPLGLGPAPQAPSMPIPLDGPQPPGPVDPQSMTADEARTEWAKVNADIAAWNARCGVENVGPLPQAQYNICVAQRGPLVERQAQIRARLKDLGIPIEGEEQPPPPAEQRPPATEEPPFPPPKQITGFTDHGAEQVNGRDGHGVSDSALQDAV
jgi:hypothetical protein